MGVAVLVLFGAYSVSGHVSSWLSLAVFVVLMALWPALWRSSLRFRLGNTSWRGLRFGFVGTVGDAYRVLLPLADRYIPIIADEYPDPEFGSGAVKITGAHDFNDYKVARAHNIPLYVLMDTKGRMADAELLSAYTSMLRIRTLDERMMTLQRQTQASARSGRCMSDRPQQ